MIDPVVFRIGVLPVHPFGLSVAIGIVAGYAVALWQVLRSGLTARYLPGMFVVVVLGSFIVARLGYVIQHPSALQDGAQDILSLWHGGLSLPWGVLGATGLLALYTWAHGEPLWAWADVLSPAAGLGLALGMLGLPAGGEGWGQPTGGPFFMTVDLRRLPPELVDATNFQPIFAYEAVLFGALSILLALLTLRQRRLGYPPAGSIGLAFLAVTMVGYGALRPLTLDASDPGLVIGTQALCVVAAAIAIGLLAPRLWEARGQAEVTREIERIRRLASNE